MLIATEVLPIDPTSFHTIFIDNFFSQLNIAILSLEIFNRS